MLKKNPNLRNYVVIGNKDVQDLLANEMFLISNQRVKAIHVEYVWFTVGYKQLLCTLNENNQNFETIRKYKDADSSKFGTLIAESDDNRERVRIREYRRFLSELIPSQISKVVSYV